MLLADQVSSVMPAAEAVLMNTDNNAVLHVELPIVLYFP